MKNVVITGANSFIGYRLCKKMSENGYFVYAVVRRETNLFMNMQNVAVIYADMSDYRKLSQKINKPCEIGIALAWNGTRGSERDDAERQKKNYQYSIDSVHAFIELGCKLVVTAGSQAEYGSWNSEKKLTEDEICHPETEYGKYKLKFYNKATEICSEKNVRIIEPRYFSLYGPDDYEGTLIIAMLRKMLKNEPCEMTKCIQIWDFLYIDDAIEALYKLIQSENTSGVYNFGSGESMELKKYVMKMYELTDSTSELLFGKVPYPKTGMVNTNPSIERLKGEIGWEPKIRFEEGIKLVMQKQKEI